MNFKRLLTLGGAVVLTLVIIFFWGCEKNQPTAPQIDETSPLHGAKTRQTCSIDLNSSRQTIRGFGGMNFPRWIDDLSSSQVDRAFGTGSGQIGLSILRISVPPNSGDWSGEVATAQRAKNHGAIVFATPWSPPASMKSNNSTTGGSLNSSSYGAYANHLRDFCDYMSSNGASLYAISVQNEPDYVPDYESCGWSASQMRTFLNNNASVIPVRVIAPETVHPKSDWYNTLSSCSQLDIYADHLYGGSPTSFSKEHWMTEHYTNSSISGNQWPDALDAGVEISNCMANNYSAYIWWYIRRSYGLLDESGNVTKRGYIMSHFSKFVRPGDTRINATHQPASNVYVTAYKNGSSLVIVAINRGSSSQNMTFSFSGNTVGNITKYETTSSSNVSNRGSVSGGSSMTNSLTGYSIATFVGTIGGGSTTTSTTSTTTTTSSGTTTTTTSGGGGSVFECEDYTSKSSSGYIGTSGSNYSGSGYFNEESNSWFEWNNVNISGNVTLRFRYAAAENGRTSTISVNGSNVGTLFNSSTGGWDSYSTEDVTASLNSGSNTIRVTRSGGNARIDRMEVIGGGTTTTTSSTTTTTSGSTTTTTSGGGANSIVVRACGVAGSEHIYCTVGGSQIGNWTLSTSYQNYPASTNNTGDINVCFDNDDGTNRDVQIDYIQVNGSTRQAEDQSYNTGVWQDGSCGGSYSEWLHCEGCIGFGDVGGDGTTTTTTSGSTTTTTSSWWWGGWW